jgi:hypothetical protein
MDDASVGWCESSSEGSRQVGGGPRFQLSGLSGSGSPTIQSTMTLPQGPETLTLQILNRQQQYIQLFFIFYCLVYC